MKKIKLAFMAAALLCSSALTACNENHKYVGGNQMVVGSRTYYYALVFSRITETRYYHIQGWAEYGPDGLYTGSSYDEIGNYVGIELQLMNGDVVYRYEPGLSYELSKNINRSYVQEYGILGD